MKLYMHISLTERHALKVVPISEITATIPKYGDCCLFADGTGHIHIAINMNFSREKPRLTLSDVDMFPIVIDGD